MEEPQASWLSALVLAESSFVEHESADSNVTRVNALHVHAASGAADVDIRANILGGVEERFQYTCFDLSFHLTRSHIVFDGWRTHGEATPGFDTRSRGLYSVLLALKKGTQAAATRALQRGASPRARRTL